jgi:hypothetical protein
MPLHPIVRAGTLGFALSLFLTGAATRAATDWTFIRLVDTTDEFVEFRGPPAVNNHDVVAVSARLSDGNAPCLIRTDGTTTVVLPDSAMEIYPDINDAGVVSYEGRSCIWKSDGTDTTLIADDSGVFNDWGFSKTSINDDGMVVFYATYDTLGYGYFLGEGDGNFVTVADTVSGRFNSLAYIPSINNAGQVTFLGHGETGQPGGIYRWEDGDLTAIDEQFGGGYWMIPAINDLGQVAYCKRVDGVRTLRIGDGSSRTPIAEESGAIAEFTTSVDINDDALVAFQATLDAGSEAILVGDADGIETLIAVGDELDGSTVEDVWFRRGLTNAGHVAFMATLADGRQGVYIAVPEPATLAILALGGLAALMHRRSPVLLLTLGDRWAEDLGQDDGAA